MLLRKCIYYNICAPLRMFGHKGETMQELNALSMSWIEFMLAIQVLSGLMIGVKNKLF